MQSPSPMIEGQQKLFPSQDHHRIATLPGYLHDETFPTLLSPYTIAFFFFEISNSSYTIPSLLRPPRSSQGLCVLSLESSADWPLRSTPAKTQGPIMGTIREQCKPNNARFYRTAIIEMMPWFSDVGSEGRGQSGLRRETNVPIKLDQTGRPNRLRPSGHLGRGTMNLVSHIG